MERVTLSAFAGLGIRGFGIERSRSDLWGAFRTWDFEIPDSSGPLLALRASWTPDFGIPDLSGKACQREQPGLRISDFRISDFGFWISDPGLWIRILTL